MSIFDALREHAALTFAQGRMLPVEAYRSEDVLAAEVAELFGRDWLCVARTADISEPGDYVVAELPHGSAATATRSLIVLRDQAGEVQAFDNVCVHRGAQLLEGCGNESRIVCPYHAWVYRLDGTLVGAPYMNGTVEDDGTPFDPNRHHLNAISTEVWEGFIFVNLDEEPEPLAPRLAELHEVVGQFEMASYVPVREEIDVWETNWKLLVENFMDAYHIFKVHKDSFGAGGDNTLDTEMYPGTLDWAHHRVVHETGPDLAAPTNTALADNWRKTIVLAAVFPGFVIQLQPNWLWFLRITPIGTDQVRIAWQVAVAPGVLEAAEDPEALVSEINALIDQVNSEDEPVVCGIRRRIQGPQFTRGPLSYLERNVFDFDRYLATRLSHLR